MYDQRKVIYEQRHELIEAKEVAETVTDMRPQVIEELVAACTPEKAYVEQWDVERPARECRTTLGLDLPDEDWAKEEAIAELEIRERIIDESDRKMAQTAVTSGPDMLRMAEKSLLLQILDHLWKEHLLQLDHLRQGIHLRGYGQRDPLNEYKKEAFVLFEALLTNLRETVTRVLSHLEIRTQPRPAPAEAVAAGAQGSGPASSDSETASRPAAAASAGPPSSWGKVPRNATCPCGSGKKYKHCHGRLA
jgi:preprotein translocase subunit SecA